jgi:prepilin-type N-terminal cleavage/methylation domain-containing protein
VSAVRDCSRPRSTNNRSPIRQRMTPAWSIADPSRSPARENFRSSPAKADNSVRRSEPRALRSPVSSFSTFYFLISNLSAKAQRGFTLLELLVVIAIIAILMVLVAPAFTTIKGGTDVTSAAYTIKDVLDQARTYAMANNTFVWVGFKEVDVSQDASVSPQTNGVGRVAIAVVASKDGTRGYDVTNTSLPNPAWLNYNNGANLVAVSKLQHLENVHLATTLNGPSNPPPTTGNMARPDIQSNNYVIGNAPTPVTPFDWPLGSALNAGQYSFQKVINFDPQGVARIQYSANSDAIAAYTEIGLQQTHGTAVSSSTNVVAIQLGGVCGSVTIYRP